MPYLVFTVFIKLTWAFRLGPILALLLLFGPSLEKQLSFLAAELIDWSPDLRRVLAGDFGSK